MPLNDDQREHLEDVIVDLHITSTKFVKSGKEIHKKMLEVNVIEAIEILHSIKNDIKDDLKVHDYKMHLLIPFQIYELIQMREEKQNDKQ